MREEAIQVLLVEDNPADARLLEEAFRESDPAAFHIQHVVRLKSAIESLALRKPDVIVLDLSLPDASGLETVRQMQVAAPGVPIVVLTGLHDEKLALDAMRQGVQDYLVKGQPGVSPSRALRYAIERSRAEESLRASEERFRLLVDGVKDYAILMLDAKGMIASWNEGAQRIKGYEAAEILGRHFSRFYLPEDVREGKPESLLRRAAQEGLAEEEGWRVRKDGTRFWADVVIRALRHDGGGLRGFAKVTRDITQKKAIETELLRAKEAAEEANKAKDNFLAVLSHELRTPLTPILAMASALQMQTDLPDELRDDLGMIHRNALMEARLIDDLLDLTRISQSKVQLHHEVVDAHAVVHGAFDLFQNEINAKRLSVTVSLSAARHHIWADASRLRQVFANLLSNAVKFTPAGGAVSVQSSNTGAGRLLIQIIDTGVGIAPEVLPRLFKSFEQGESAVMRRFGGLGLGLSIAKSITEMHKGAISAASQGRDQGATLSVEFDVIPPITAPPPALVLMRGSGKYRILLVEDHEETRQVMTRLLTHSGCSVSSAGSVKEALELAEAATFDLLVSDIGLPDGSGLDIMKDVKARYRLRGIALSGYGRDDDLRKSREAGFETHLTKPVDFRRLQDVIRSMAG